MFLIIFLNGFQFLKGEIPNISKIEKKNFFLKIRFRLEVPNIWNFPLLQLKTIKKTETKKLSKNQKLNFISDLIESPTFYPAG